MEQGPGVRLFRSRIILLVYFLLMCVPVLAKPMAAFTLTEGVRQADAILVATYTGYTPPQNPTDYFGSVTKTFRVEKVLKGSINTTSVKVSEAFQNGSACLPLPGWRFNPQSMPHRGSRWILLLEQAPCSQVSQACTHCNAIAQAVDSTQTTCIPWVVYRGFEGRLPLTAAALKKVSTLLDAK